MAYLQSLLFFLFSLVALGLAKELPQFAMTIAPTFNETSVTFLNSTLRIRDPSAKVNRTLVTFNTQGPLSPSQRYDDDGLTATDDQGELPIPYHTAENGDRNWAPSRQPVGDIIVKFAAEPRGNISGLVGRNDLRFDQGGALGQGSRFIPYPPSQERWEFTLDWEIPESAPAGTRFASSLGDRQGGRATGLPSTVIYNSYFAVGQLNRWPDWDDADGASDSRSDSEPEFGMYWIGDLPWNSTELASRTKDIYLGTASYFSSDMDFRVFCRHDFEDFGGVGGFQSFILGYYEGSEEENPLESVEQLLSHEIIHEFAIFHPETMYDKWYIEGIAQYLSAIGPYSGGALDRTTFVQWMNNMAQDYYTASPLNATWDSVVNNYWHSGPMGIKLPYTRGCMYLMYVQGLIATATNHEHGVDDVILELYRMYNNGDKVRTPQFISTLAKYIGQEAAQASFDAMANGKVLIPSPDAYSTKGMKMVQKKLEKYELGFDADSVNDKVSGLIPGSRAEQAGVRNGDEVVDSWGVFASSDTYEHKMKMVVRRNGTEVPIYWHPRSHHKVPTWTWIDTE